MTYNLSRVEIILLERALRSPDGVFIGMITSKLGISIREAALGFRSLRKRRLLEERNSSLYLTSKGRGWVMENQTIFAFSGERTWRQVPDHFKGNAIQAFEPYAPRLSKLSKRSFGLGQRREG